MYGILVSATVIKTALWLYCRRFGGKSDSIAALAEDHLNDVMSNSAAIATALAATYWPETWWLDSAGGILISVWIIARWFIIITDQVRAASIRLLQAFHASLFTVGLEQPRC